MDYYQIILDTVSKAVLWSFERVVRISFFVVILYLITSFFPQEPSEVLLVEATVNDLMGALVLPLLFVIWFWHVMSD